MLFSFHEETILYKQQYSIFLLVMLTSLPQASISAARCLSVLKMLVPTWDPVFPELTQKLTYQPPQ